MAAVDYYSMNFGNRRLAFIRHCMAHGLDRSTAIELAALAEPESACVLSASPPSVPYRRRPVDTSYPGGATGTEIPCIVPAIGVEMGLLSSARMRGNPVLEGLRRWGWTTATSSGFGARPPLSLNGTLAARMEPGISALWYGLSLLRENRVTEEDFTKFASIFSFGPTQLSAASGRRVFNSEWVLGTLRQSDAFGFIERCSFYVVGRDAAAWGEYNQAGGRPRDGHDAGVRWLHAHTGGAISYAQRLYDEGDGARRPYAIAYQAALNAAAAAGI